MTDRFAAGVLVGQPGNQCRGYGTCGAALLHEAKAKCSQCGSSCFDHLTDEPMQPYCLDCGHPWEGDIPEVQP